MSESGDGMLEDREADEEANDVEIDRGSSNDSIQKISIANDEHDFAELPVIAYKAEIMDCIRQNRIVICISETGRYKTSIATHISHRHISTFFSNLAHRLVEVCFDFVCNVCEKTALRVISAIV